MEKVNFQKIRQLDNNQVSAIVDGERMKKTMRNIIDTKRQRKINTVDKWKEDLLNEYPDDNLEPYVPGEWATLWNKKSENDEKKDEWYTYNSYEEEGWDFELSLWYEDTQMCYYDE